MYLQQMYSQLRNQRKESLDDLYHLRFRFFNDAHEAMGAIGRSYSEISRAVSIAKSRDWYETKFSAVERKQIESLEVPFIRMSDAFNDLQNKLFSERQRWNYQQMLISPNFKGHSGIFLDLKGKQITSIDSPHFEDGVYNVVAQIELIRSIFRNVFATELGLGLATVIEGSFNSRSAKGCGGIF